MRHGRDSAKFDFTRAMRHVVKDMVLRLPELQHIQLDRVAITYCQARKRVSHGLYATLTPMRFEGGERTSNQNGRTYAVQQIRGANGEEMLYILSFYLPRFMEVSFSEKLVTIFHELWHISPDFNGDLRRHPGRCYMHTGSQKEYDAEMARLAKRWLALAPPEHLYAFLQLDFQQLLSVFGGVCGERVPRPKLYPV